MNLLFSVTLFFFFPSLSCILHLASYTWHVQLAVVIHFSLYLALLLTSHFFSVACFLHSFMPLSMSVFHPMSFSPSPISAWFMWSLAFFQACALFILFQFPLCQLSFLDVFEIRDGPLPSFHCYLFPLHTALFSAAVQIQARTGHN